VKRILLRASKHPLNVVSPEATLRRNLIGTNSGNLVFIEAAHKLLSVRGVEVRPDRFKTDPSLADEINEQYDVYVIPLANAFRLSFEPKLIRLTAVIEKLKIPVVVLGVGAQANLDYDLRRLRPIEASVKRFVSAVLDRSTSIGVRGELTETYLRSLGFNDVEVIGCPSMFLYGPDLRIEKSAERLTPRSSIAINVSPNMPEMAEIVRWNAERYPKLRYIAQDLGTLDVLLNGDDAVEPGHQLPIPPSHPIMRSNRTRLYVDPWPWIDDLSGFDFSFGTRIHGNISALLAGTPAYVLAHDSRTLELARYFKIPHRAMSGAPEMIDAADLHAAAEYGELNSGHAARFAAFADYLHRNGLADVFTDGDKGRHFDAAMQRRDFPPGVDASRIADSSGFVRDALRSDSPLRRRMAARIRRLKGRLPRREKAAPSRRRARPPAKDQRTSS
jgi:hypothetical protein